MEQLADEGILLVESEQSVIKDVSCSLRLVNLAVHEAATVSDAREWLLGRHPKLVIARAGLVKDPQASVQLFEVLEKQKKLKHVPVAVLATSSEHSMLGDRVELFDAEFPLPVEFPTITYQIKDLLHEFSAGRKTRREKLAAPQDERGEIFLKDAAELGAEAAAADLVNLMTGESGNLLLAYHIQLAVLDALRANINFKSVGPERVPDIIASVTQSVCRSFVDKKSGK